MGIGIAFAGGGIRGIAHVGVLKALEENNIKIEAVGGTSAGSIVAALYAMGYKPYYIYVLFKKYAQDIINIGNSSIVNGIGNFVKTKKIGIAGLNDGTLLEKMFNELATRKKMKAVADIKMPLVIPAVDIAEAKEYIFTNCAPRNNVNDEYITYSLSSKYQLMKDISLNGNDIWTLPSDFTGTFNHGTVDENSTLYDSSTDTIYIYNDYQLKIIQSDNSENEPVMSQDMLPECVGMGQPVYSDNSSNYLTYSKSHNYVLSKNFTGEMPEIKANQISNISTENCEGRDFNGQVVKTIGDKTYILIGNEEQLRKIGSDETVYGAVYQVYLHAANWYVDEDENGNPIMLYGGDADLKKSQNGNANFEFGKNNNIKNIIIKKFS